MTQKILSKRIAFLLAFAGAPAFFACNSGDVNNPESSTDKTRPQ